MIGRLAKYCVVAGMALPMMDAFVKASTLPWLLRPAIVAWYAAAVLFPLYWLSGGRIVSATGTSGRRDDPFGFWLGVATYTVVLWMVAIVMNWALGARLG